MCKNDIGAQHANEAGDVVKPKNILPGDVSPSMESSTTLSVANDQGSEKEMPVMFRRLSYVAGHERPRDKQVADLAERVCLLAFFVSSVVLFTFWAQGNPFIREAFVMTFFVCIIACLCYMAKVAGYGDINIKTGHPKTVKIVPLARYVDWILTTPLLLHELCSIGGAPDDVTWMIVGCDIIMIATGAVSACLSNKRHMLIMFAISTAFYLVVICSVQVFVANAPTMPSRPDEVRWLFSRLECLTISVWTFYPIVAFFGPTCLGKISRHTEITLMCVLDVVAKVGMEGMLVYTCNTVDCHPETE